MNLKPDNEIKQSPSTYAKAYRTKNSTMIKGEVAGEHWSLVINDLLISLDLYGNYICVHCSNRESFKIQMGNDFCNAVLGFIVEEQLIYQTRNQEKGISSN